MTMFHGSLFTGYGGLDLAVEEVLPTPAASTSNDTETVSSWLSRQARRADVHHKLSQPCDGSSERRMLD